MRQGDMRQGDGSSVAFSPCDRGTVLVVALSNFYQVNIAMK
jgi:hypothetical protein